MNAKIEWYREVLELEPGSKVFFPLARLLGESGESDEAIRVLRQGLERHPEYTEARLLLIDLLHASGADAATELSGLTRLLCAYPGFWSAWSSQARGTDLGPALAFLTASLQVPGLSFAQIFNAGLQACCNGAGLGTASGIAQTGTSPDRADSGKPDQTAMAAMATMAGMTPESLGGSGSRGVQSATHVPVGPDLASLAAALRTRDATPKVASGTVSSAQQSAPRADVGRVTLRTRSMAEVLAEQGDTQGAIDIYTEIFDAAPGGVEAEELHARIQSLRSRLDPLSGGASPVAPVMTGETGETGMTSMTGPGAVRTESVKTDAADPEDAGHPTTGKKMRNMLEHLAERLDVRAKG